MRPANPATAAVEVLLLAAGRSRRMGAVDKLLLPVALCGHGEEPMVRHAARLYCALGLPVTVVTSPQNTAVTAALADLDITLVCNRDPLAEQADSLRTGLAATALIAPGLLIALADQPLLTPADIAALLAFFGHNPGKICIPRHAGQRGNPVILPASLARQLRDYPTALTPRAYMDRHPDEIAWFACESPNFTTDIDTPQDTARLLPSSPHIQSL